jgi:hypothetical protein
MTEVEPIARTKPINVRLTNETYELTYLVCRGCGARVALIDGVWIHKITGRAQCYRPGVVDLGPGYPSVGRGS